MQIKLCFHQTGGVGEMSLESVPATHVLVSFFSHFNDMALSIGWSTALLRTEMSLKKKKK